MLNSRCRYALKALGFLAREPRAPHTTEQIAVETAIPLATLAKILQSLNHAGLVKTQRGVGGGVELASDPTSLNVKQVIEAIDPASLVYYGTMHQVVCPGLARRLTVIEELTRFVLRETTLSELIDKSAESDSILDRKLDQVSALIRD